MKRLQSNIDKSCNYIIPYKGSDVECRFVQRRDDQLIVYVSSHNGCKMVCRFCHLTQNGLTSFDEVDLNCFREQIETVVNHYKDNVSPQLHQLKYVNINFMARGEALANSFVRDGSAITTIWSKLLYLGVNSAGYNKPKIVFNVSSIIPKESVDDNPLLETDDRVTTRLYYSLYSLDPVWRKRWMPNAADPNEAVKKIKIWLNETGRGESRELVIHGAFIKGENDSDENIKAIKDFINVNDLKCKFNLVAYNPFSEKQGAESDNLDEIVNSLSDATDVQVVPRVGFDVAASCGMFVKG